MGIKGDKMSQESVISAELLVEKLSGLGDVSSKKMFGGHGIFFEGKMFGLIDSKGKAFLKVNDDIKQELEGTGSEQHSKMPYYSITEDIFNNLDELTDWAKKSIKISK